MQLLVDYIIFIFCIHSFYRMSCSPFFFLLCIVSQRATSGISAAFSKWLPLFNSQPLLVYKSGSNLTPSFFLSLCLSLFISFSFFLSLSCCSVNLFPVVEIWLHQHRVLLGILHVYYRLCNLSMFLVICLFYCLPCCVICSCWKWLSRVYIRSSVKCKLKALF